MKPRLMNDCAVARTNWQKYMPRLIEIPRKDFFAFSQLFCFSAALVARSPVIHVDSGHDQHLRDDEEKSVVCFVRNREHSIVLSISLPSLGPEACN